KMVWHGCCLSDLPMAHLSSISCARNFWSKSISRADELMRLAQPQYVNDGHLGEPHHLSSHEASMARDNTAIGISQDGVYETELPRDDVIYLLFGMCPGVISSKPIRPESG